VSLWTLTIAVLFLKEVVTIKKIIAVLFGMADILVILKPGIEIIELTSLVVLIAVIGYAVSHVTTKSLSNTEYSLTVLFYMCLVQSTVSFLFVVDTFPAGSVTTISPSLISPEPPVIVICVPESTV